MASSKPTDTRPLIISGPSGVGKGTLYNLLLERHPGTFSPTVSHTTRSPRPGESDGVHYHFVPRAAFASLVSSDGFIEHATFGSNSYGTSRATLSSIRASGKIPILDIEMEGVKQIKAKGKDGGERIEARYVFIAPPSWEELERRLRGRGTETEESVQKRLAQARKEMEWGAEGKNHDLVVVNGDLEKAYRELEAFVLGGEKRTQEQGAKEGGMAGVSVQD